METKQSLGAFICRRRKELGLTQRELADRLFVTESAVSKWERGLSYPDITLVRELCNVLEVSEHELLTASEDAEARTVQRLARRYLSLIQTCRRVQYLLYGGLALTFLIANLIQGHLGWLGIALAGEAMAMSLTLIPALIERNKSAWMAGGFALSFLLLMGACALYSGGGWFFPAALGTLLAEGVLLSPLVLRQLPLGAWSGRKTTLYMGLNTVLLLLLLLVCDLQGEGGWFLTAALGALLAEGVCLLPLVLRQLPLPAPLSRHKAVLWCGTCSVLLMALLAVSCIQTGGDWFWSPALPLALLGLALPWSWVLLLRYPPCSLWYRGALSCAAGAVWQFCLPWTLQRLTASPDFSWDQAHPFGLRPDFARWDLPAVQAENMMALICLGLLLLAGALALAGRLRRPK